VEHGANEHIARRRKRTWWRVVKVSKVEPWAAARIGVQDGAAKVWAGQFRNRAWEAITLLRPKRARICRHAGGRLGLSWTAWRGRRSRDGRRDGGGFRRVKPNATDIEILFDGPMQEIGELQSSDIAAPFTNLALQVTDHFLRSASWKARVEELIPKSLPVKGAGSPRWSVSAQYKA